MIKLSLIVFIFGLTLLITILLAAEIAFAQTPTQNAFDETRILNVDSQTNVKTEGTVAPAAALSIQVCQKGVSGSIESGGFAIENTEGFCDWIRLSDVMLGAYKVQKELGNEEYANLYLGYYYNAMDKANTLITKTEYTTYIDRLFRDMLIPLAMIIGLVILI